MSRRRSFGLPGVALLCATALATGCNSSGNNDLGPAPADPLVRFAHYVDGLRSVDICLKGPNDADFVGPIALTKLMRPGGVPFSYTSGYVSLSAGSYTLRIVSGTATSCATALFGPAFDIDTDSVAVGRRYTLAGMGVFDDLRTFRLVLLEDDNSVDENMARVRFVHAIARTGGIDFGSGSGANFAGLATAGAYTEVAEAAGQPYVKIAPTTMATYSARPTGSSVDLKAVSNKVTLDKGQVYTATFTTYVGATPDYQLSLCQDTGTLDQGLIPCKELR